MTKSEQTLKTIEVVIEELKQNPLTQDSVSLINVWLQDIAISLSIIADWCIKDKEEKKT